MLLLQQCGELLELVEAVEEVYVELDRLAIVECYGQNAIILVISEVRNFGDDETLYFDVTLAKCRIGDMIGVDSDGTGGCRRGTGWQL